MPTRGLSRRDLALALAVPLVMLLVAGLAAVRYHAVEQSSWQGVGFGMFATLEYAPARTLRVWQIDAGVRVPLAIPDDLRDDVDRVLAAPGDKAAVVLAEELRRRTGVASLQLEVWNHEVHGADRQLEVGFRRLRRVIVP